MRKPKAPAPKLLEVRLLEASPNPLFTEWQRSTIRFLRYNMAVPCAECGKRRRTHWTALYEFMAHTMAQYVPFRSGVVHAPLTPVCRDHLLALGIAEPKEQTS